MTDAASTTPNARFDGRWLVEVLILAALYFLTARLGLLMAIPGGYVTPVWPPSGIALAALLLRGRRVWPGIWLGCFAADAWDFYGSLTTGLAMSVTFGIGASLAALVGSQLLRRFVRERNPLERVRDVCAFMALGGGASCLVSATIGATTLCLAGSAPWPGFGQVWLTWWLGDTAGVLVAAPLLLVWGGTLWRTSAARWVELFCAFGLLIAVTYYIFNIENTTTLVVDGPALAFALFPLLMWPAVRFEQRGAATTVGVIALLAVWGTAHGSGPFNLGSRQESLLALELFLSAVSLTALCLAAAVTAQRHAENHRRRVLDELESRVMERTASLHQANAALQESEARTRLLIKSSNIGLWDWNLVTNEVFFSPEWKNQLGYADDELPNSYEEWENRLHPEDRGRTLRAVQDFRECWHQDYEIEFRLRHKDGSWRSILTRADLTHDASGQPVRMMGCHIDITERKHAEVASIRLAAIVESSDDAIISKNLDGVIISWNAAAEEIYGYSAAEIIGRPITILAPPNQHDEINKILESIKRGEPIEHFQTTRLRKDGRQISVSLSISPVRNREGEITGASAIARDISKQKQTEASVKEQALRYKTLMETSTDSIYVLNEKGDLQEANAAFLRRRGYTAAEVKGFSVEDWDARWTREELQARLRELPDGGTMFETRHRCKDRSVFDVEVCATGVRIGGEQLVFCVTRDITERKQAERARYESEERFRQIAENINEVFWVWTATPGNPRLLYVSPAYATIWGRSCESLYSSPQSWKDALHPRDKESILAEIADLDLEKSNDLTYRVVRPDQSIRWIRDRIFPVRGEDGVVFRFAGIAEDITERRLAEEALRDSEERFRELTENINEVFWVWTATPGNARCLYVSPAYATIWGQSCESLYGSPQSWMDALHPQDQGRVREEGARMDPEKISDWTYRVVRPDQSIRWIRDRIFPIRDVRGAVFRFAGIAQDITESKEAEEAVRKANRQLRTLSRRRIQEQEDERRRLSRELHDQIGQSLTAAKINVEVIRTLENPACLGRIDETITILDQLLGQVRQISLDLRPPMLDDLGLVPALRSFVDEQGRRASVAVRFTAEHIPEKLDPEIQITCFRIAQEAITNAVRHAKATQLEIALRCTPGKKLRLLARDNGIGFAAQPKQAQAVDLGLIGIRERAALVGGRAKIISSPHKGTTIDVSLPLTFRPEHSGRRMGISPPG